MNEKISLARIYYPVKVLGPGNRVGIWLNGCNKKCPGCISPEMQFYDHSKEFAVSDIVKMLQSIKDRIDGFTISGGEPFFNPRSLSILLQSLAKICDDILIFTGFTLDELKEQESDDINSVLNNCSVIIDGPYVKELKVEKGLRGSSNQQINIFKYHDRYSNIEIAERALQTIVYNDRVLTIGIP